MFTARNRKIRLLICANFIVVICYCVALSDNINLPVVQSRGRCRGKRRAGRFLSLELGAWCFFGVWHLELFAGALSFSEIDMRPSHLKDFFELSQIPRAVAGDVGD